MDARKLIPCARPDIPVQNFCTPTCTRWTGINAGQPIRLYHDLQGTYLIGSSPWDPTVYQNARAPDPTVYLQEVIDLWQSAVPCRQLFEIVQTPQEADFIVRYAFEDSNEPCAVIGSATCLCDNDDDVCVNQFDHSAIFRPLNSGVMTMYYVDCLVNSLTEPYWVNVYAHELGHVLGMGHIYGLPDNSVMGGNPTLATQVQLFDWDVEQIQLRHPCGCELVENMNVFQPRPKELFHSSCPGCRVETFLNHGH